MDISVINLLLTTGAGILSVASPCILPVIPIVITGTQKDHKYRPILITVGLSISFIIMGIVSSLFGYLLAGKMGVIEKASGILFIVFGVLMLLDTNLFKGITFFNKLQNKPRGKWSGLVLGLTLGLIWIPCIGPMLSSILSMVAAKGQVLEGVVFLAFYSLGFSIPILIAGYSTQFFRNKVSVFRKHPLVIRFISGGILIVFGLYIVFNGLVSF